GLAVLLVEQRAQRTVALANRSHVLANGQQRLTLGPESAGDTGALVSAYMACLSPSSTSTGRRSPTRPDWGRSTHSWPSGSGSCSAFCGSWTFRAGRASPVVPIAA